MPTPRIAGKVFGQLPIGFLPNLRPASVLSYEDLFRSWQRLPCHGTTCGSFDEHVVALRLRGHRRQFKPEVNKPNTNSALLYVYRPYTLCLEVRDWDALNRLFRKGYLHDALTGVRAAVSTFRWRPKLKLEIRPSYLENYSSRRKKSRLAVCGYPDVQFHSLNIWEDRYRALPLEKRCRRAPLLLSRRTGN